MSIRFHLFLSVFKVFWCIRFCYVYPDTGMCSCISIIRIHFQNIGTDFKIVIFPIRIA